MEISKQVFIIFNFLLIIISSLTVALRVNSTIDNNPKNAKDLLDEITPKIIRIKSASLTEISRKQGKSLQLNDDTNIIVIKPIKAPPFPLSDDGRHLAQTPEGRQGRKFSKTGHSDNDGDNNIGDYNSNLKFLSIKPAIKKRRRYRKKLKFIFDDIPINGNDSYNKETKIVRVHLAPGAYPIFYGIAKVNGKFLKDTIKSFKADEFS